MTFELQGTPAASAFIPLCGMTHKMISQTTCRSTFLGDCFFIS